MMNSNLKNCEIILCTIKKNKDFYIKKHFNMHKIMKMFKKSEKTLGTTVNKKNKKL